MKAAIALLLSTGFVFALVPRANAYSCAINNNVQKAELSKVVFYGLVEKIKPGKKSLDDKHVRFKVIERFKGKVSKRVWLDAGTDEAPDGAYFVVGSKYLIFLQDEKPKFINPCFVVQKVTEVDFNELRKEHRAK